VILRIAIAAGLAVSGISHADLYAHGYQHIPIIGMAFLVQGSVFLAIAALIVVGGPQWLSAAAGLLSVGAVVAFALSRTVGLAGFIERGWEPAPHALISVTAEFVTVFACGAWWFNRRRTPSTAR
jgi:hypothetical protein